MWCWGGDVASTWERRESAGSLPPHSRFHQRERQPTCPTACVLWAPGLVSGVGATAGGFGCGWCCLRCHSLSPQALLKDIQAGSATLAADFQPLCCSVQTSPLFTACGHCYVIRTWVLMAVMITDIILTLLITVSVFCLMMTLKRQRDPESERCLPLPDGSILLHTHMKMGFYLSRWKNCHIKSNDIRSRGHGVTLPGKNPPSYVQLSGLCINWLHFGDKLLLFCRSYRESSQTCTAN